MNPEEREVIERAEDLAAGEGRALDTHQPRDPHWDYLARGSSTGSRPWPRVLRTLDPAFNPSRELAEKHSFATNGFSKLCRGVCLCGFKGTRKSWKAHVQALHEGVGV